MRLDHDLHQRVAGRPLAGRGRALALEAQRLAVLDAGRDRHVQRAALGQGDGANRPVDGVEKRHVQFVMQVGAGGAAHLLPLLLAAAPQELGEDVVALGEIGVALGAFVRMPRAAGVFAIVAPLRRGLLGARGVDLAGVVAAPLVRVGQEVVGRRHFLEPLLGVLVAGIEVRMQFLGQLPVGLADLLGGRGLGEAEDLVGVFHADVRDHAGSGRLSRIGTPSPDLSDARGSGIVRGKP